MALDSAEFIIRTTMLDHVNYHDLYQSRVDLIVHGKVEISITDILSDNHIRNIKSYIEKHNTPGFSGTYDIIGNMGETRLFTRVLSASEDHIIVRSEKTYVKIPITKPIEIFSKILEIFEKIETVNNAYRLCICPGHLARSEGDINTIRGIVCRAFAMPVIPSGTTIDEVISLTVA